MVKPLRQLMANAAPFLLAGMTVFTGACNRPDLVPERRSGGTGAEGYCQRDNAGNLIVRVRNQSNENVLAQTTTVVVFSPGGPRTAPTAPLPGGSAVDVALPMPGECFNADCDFKITVDSDQAAAETNESNNAADGICIG